MIEIAVDDEEIVRRMSGRRVHPGSGRTYHVEFNPPRNEGLDDETGEPLVQRDDDKEATVRERLKVYHEQTKPLVAFYQQMEKEAGSTVTFGRVDGTGTVDAIKDRIAKILTG